jgi:hypothetical protein
LIYRICLPLPADKQLIAAGGATGESALLDSLLVITWK